MKKHSSYETAPDKPFFKLKGSGIGVSPGISPSKRINLRSECIDQLDKWHDLFQRGVISQQQYDELQATILSDITKF